jgi:hypothetical protein
MREDMAKVIVERPRHGGGIRYPRPLGNWRGDADTDDVRHEGIRRPWLRYCCVKGLNENLAPLRRYLQSNVGRPWNKVHQEICQRINLNSAVQLHIWQHLKEYVCMHPIRRDGQWVDARGRPLWSPFLVDPLCGLLRANENTFWRDLRNRRRRAATPPPDFVPGQDGRCYRRIEGIWYEFILSPFPPARLGHFDFALKRELMGISRAELIAFHGAPVYASHKRQLNSKEIRRLNLAGTACP